MGISIVACVMLFIAHQKTACELRQHISHIIRSTINYKKIPLAMITFLYGPNISISLLLLRIFYDVLPISYNCSRDKSDI